MSRGDGARLSLLTLTRGESGDNAIGPELFDALGLIRTEELRVAGRYYGVDEQYFTTMVDYGYSKRLDETFSKWKREDALGDVVRIIRTSRPWIILSRDRQRFLHEHQELEIRRIEPLMPVSYLLSGGVSRRAFVPAAAISICIRAERALGRLARSQAMFAAIHMVRR